MLWSAKEDLEESVPYEYQEMLEEWYTLQDLFADPGDRRLAAAWTGIGVQESRVHSHRTLSGLLPGTDPGPVARRPGNPALRDVFQGFLRRRPVLSGPDGAGGTLASGRGHLPGRQPQGRLSTLFPGTSSGGGASAPDSQAAPTPAAPPRFPSRSVAGAKDLLVAFWHVEAIGHKARGTAV